MEVIFIPGFWDSPNKFDNVAKLLEEENIGHKFLDYKDYKKFGKKLDSDIFAKMVDSLCDDFNNSIVVCYSMGASFFYDYLKTHNVKPSKLIFVNPLMEKVGNQFTASYKRVLDMHKQKQFVESLKKASSDLLPLTDVAYLQQEFNRQIVFDKNFDLDAVFVWGDKDIICPITNYDKYKEYFSNTNLVTVFDQHHNWMVYDEPVKQYLLPAIKDAKV